jgi:hypothetical protein
LKLPGRGQGSARLYPGRCRSTGAIIDRIRDHIKKAPPRKDRFDLNEAINEEPITFFTFLNQGRSGESVMTNRADIYRQKAHEYERAATRVADPQVQASYRQMSRQWNEMAQRQQTIDEALAELLKPLE